MARHTLSDRTYYVVCPRDGDDELLAAWLHRSPPDVRRGFLAALLIIDGRTTLRDVVAGFDRLPQRVVIPDPAGELAEDVVAVEVAICGWCGELLSEEERGPNGGRPRVYHSGCRNLAAVALRRQGRARAKRVTAKVPEV